MSRSSKRIKLSKIPSLTFYADRNTVEGQRGPAVPQLECQGSACRYDAPEVVHCTNLGGEGNAIDWKCEASLPANIRFGRTTVSCEGWSNPEDPYILKGSCALSYNLIMDDPSLREDYFPRSPRRSLAQSKDSNWFYYLFIAVFLYLAYKFFTGRPDPHARAIDNGDNAPPPPPYNPNDGDPPKFRAAFDVPPRQYNFNNFWTGLAAGSAATAVGRNLLGGRTEQDSRPRERRVFGNRLERDFDRGEGSSTSMRTATGFGGTSNR